MVTFRQLEALVWTVRLKTLSRAAHRLNTAQPTISKRLQELEAGCGFAVFEREGRSVRLTKTGEELYRIAEQMLALAMKIEELRDLSDAMPVKVSIGVTELAAHTWLPRMIDRIAKDHPAVVAQLTIEHSTPLREKLKAGALDLIVCPSFVHDDQLTSIEAQEVEMVLVASPKLCEGDRIFSGQELGRFTLLSHGPQGAVRGFLHWMNDIGFKPEQTVSIDSLVALIGMAIAGMGLTLIPKACFGALLESDRLVIVQTTRAAPWISYRIYFRRAEADGVIGRLAKSIETVCDFRLSYEAEML